MIQQPFMDPRPALEAEYARAVDELRERLGEIKGVKGSSRLLAGRGSCIVTWSPSRSGPRAGSAMR